MSRSQDAAADGEPAWPVVEPARRVMRADDQAGAADGRPVAVDLPYNGLAGGLADAVQLALVIGVHDLENRCFFELVLRPIVFGVDRDGRDEHVLADPVVKCLSRELGDLGQVSSDVDHHVPARAPRAPRGPTCGRRAGALRPGTDRGL